MSLDTREIEVERLIKPLMITDLRIQCRARGLNPGGGKETLMERLKEHMLKTGDMSIVSHVPGEVQGSSERLGSVAGSSCGGTLKNNYVRPEGQNVGNFITDRPSSRVLAPPGGGSRITLG